MVDPLVLVCSLFAGFFMGIGLILLMNRPVKRHEKELPPVEQDDDAVHYR